jgi:hypothetical protein
MDPRTSPREVGGSRTLLVAMMALQQLVTERGESLRSVARRPAVRYALDERQFGRVEVSDPGVLSRGSPVSAGPERGAASRDGADFVDEVERIRSPWAGEPGGIRLSRREMRSGSHRGNAVMQRGRLTGSAHACRVQGLLAAVRMSVRAGRRACLVPGAGLPADCLGELPGVIGKAPLLAGNCAEAP